MNNVSLADIVVRLNPLWLALQQLLELFILPLLAVVSFAAAVYMAIRLQQPAKTRSGDNAATVLTLLGIAVVSIHFSNFGAGLWQGVFGTEGNRSVMFTYRPANLPPAYAGVIESCLRFVALMGWYYMARGVYLARQISSGQAAQAGDASATGRVFAHVGGGLVAINIDKFLDAVGVTVGLSA